MKYPLRTRFHQILFIDLFVYVFVHKAVKNMER